MGKLDQEEVKDSYSFEEVSKIFKLKKEELEEFEAEGVFEYRSQDKKEIDRINFERLKTAISLKRELGVNTPGIDIILGMKEKIAHLQSELQLVLQSMKEKMGMELEEDLKKIASELKNKNK